MGLNGVKIVRGGSAHMAALARWHYRAGRPARPVRVLAAIDRRGDTVGVLVAARPVLNGPWREAAWPGHFARGGLRARARRINRELTVIARVIVDPRWRGLGVAVALVRAYLRDPCTPRTEALAAMGHASPFFTRAGMRAVQAPPSGRTRRLVADLAELGLVPSDLACPARLPRSRGLSRAVRRWAAASRATRGRADGPLAPLCVRAGAAAWPVLAFVHEQRRVRRKERS